MAEFESKEELPASEEEGLETYSEAEVPAVVDAATQNAPPLEKLHSKDVNNMSSIPNGGLTAWLQVVGGFFLLFNTWGIVNTFGAYQTYYETGELFRASSSTISWIGAIEGFLLLFVGMLTGPVYDAGYFRYLLFIGSFLIVFGQMMLSLCKEYWQALLCQAFCIGIGSGCLFIPGVGIVSTYFSTRLAFAVGICASGSSLGGVIYPIVFHRLQVSIGFAWTTRVIGFMMLATLAVPLVVMRVRVLPPKKRKLFDPTALKEPAYMFFIIGGLFGFAGLFIPLFYTQYYAIATNITNPNLGFYLLAIINGISVLGRIVPNFIADKTGPLNLLVPCAFISGILAFCLLGIHNVGGIVTFSVLFGFFSGTFVSLPPTVFVQLTTNRALIGTRLGMGFGVFGIGALIGTPVAGAILGSNDNFVGVWIFSGVLIMAASTCFTLTRYFKAGVSLRVKA